MAVADVYDALISPRVYKESMPHEKTLDQLTHKSKDFGRRVITMIGDTLIARGHRPILP
jgi:HD-GYP domain-containing protein (c-di-GMP phosphodiesterase class II)